MQTELTNAPSAAGEVKCPFFSAVSTRTKVSWRASWASVGDRRRDRNFSDYGLHYFNMQVDFCFQLLRRFYPAALTQQLRASVRTPLAWQSARRARVTVTAWVPPWPGWSGRLGPLPGLVRHRVRFPTHRRGTVVVDVTLARTAR